MDLYHTIATQEVVNIRTHAPVTVIIHSPQSQEGKLELSRRVAEIHADAVIHRIKSLNCPTSQKSALLEAVIQTAKERSKGQT